MVRWQGAGAGLRGMRLAACEADVAAGACWKAPACPACPLVLPPASRWPAPLSARCTRSPRCAAVNYCGKMEADTFILRQAQQYIDQGVAKASLTAARRARQRRQLLGCTSCGPSIGLHFSDIWGC